MKRAIVWAALAAVCAVPVPSQAASTQVFIAGFQYAPSGWVTADPLGVSGGAGSVALPTGGAPTVRRGDILVFNNADALPHTVTKLSGPSGTWPSFTVTGAGGALGLIIPNTFGLGTYIYRCMLHLGMRGSFIVV